MVVNQQSLARRLRLSRTTVSRSLSNHPAISAETRDRVLAAAGQLGYGRSPTRAVRRPRQAKPLTVGVLIGSPLVAEDTATFPAILSGMRRRAAIEHLDLDVLSMDPRDLTGETGRRQLFRQVRAAGWRGVVLVYPFPDDAVAMISRKLSAVTVLTEYDNAALDVIDTDHGGIRKAVSALVEAGHRRIGYVTWRYPSGGQWASRRFAAYMEGLFAHQVSFNPDHVLNVGKSTAPTPEAVADHVARALRNDGVTAWVCAADHQAYRLIADLRARGIEVPRDCSITGFDGNTTPPGLPSLATLRVPNDEVGSSTIAGLMSRLLHPRSSRRTLHVETTFVPGATIAPPPLSPQPIHG